MTHTKYLLGICWAQESTLEDTQENVLNHSKYTFSKYYFQKCMNFVTKHEVTPHRKSQKPLKTMSSIKKEYVFGLRKTTKSLKRDFSILILYCHFENENFARKRNESQR